MGEAQYLHLGKDAIFYERLLSRNESSLFEPSQFGFETMRLELDTENSNRPNLQSQIIASVLELGAQLCHDMKKSEVLFYLIPQLYSWGHLQISREAFQRIFEHHRVFAPYLYILNEFGSKIRDELPRCNNFYAYCHPNTCSLAGLEARCRSHHDYEITYIFQYMERNGRNRGDPWSLRRTGVYQQARYDRCQSAWIFLKLSHGTRIALRKALQGQIKYFADGDGPMTFHALLLGATVDNWGEYICDLSARLHNLDEKACFAKVRVKSPHDYSIDFSDMQLLQRLRHKILKTSLALSSCLDVTTKLEEHCNTLDKLGFTPQATKTKKALNLYSADIKVHQQSVRVIADTLEGTYDLLSKIIDFRNIESLRSITEASEKHMVYLKDMTLHIRNENYASATTAVRTQHDARTMKALTTTATALLPASLIATIFSSSLVQVKQRDGSNGQDTHLFVAKQFWIYVVITLAFTILTLGCTRLLQWR